MVLLVQALVCLPLWGGVRATYYNGSDAAPCDSPLYCYGQILQEIQLARPFTDSKTFVDMYVYRIGMRALACEDSLTGWDLQGPPRPWWRKSREPMTY